MPAPLVQIPAAWKLPPVERNINIVGKFMTCTQANQLKVWNSLDKNIKITFLNRFKENIKKRIVKK